MKFTYMTNFVLMFILILALFIGTFFGAKLQEGITINKLTILIDILNKTNRRNAKSNMDAIKSMNIEDPDFAYVINHDKLSDVKKILQLKLMIRLLPEYNINDKPLNDIWVDDLKLDD